jgi:hypothetical protein
MSTTNFSQDCYAVAAQEDRSAPRTRIAIPASLRASGTKSVQTVVHDLSLSGFSCSSINRLHVGTICWLQLPGLESLQAEVIWWNNSQVGCAFHSLLNPIVHDNLLARFCGDSAFRTVS